MKLNLVITDSDSQLTIFRLQHWHDDNSERITPSKQRQS